MTVSIHPTSIINPKAIIGKNVSIGPFCIIGEQVVLGNNVKIHSHVLIDGNTIINENVKIFSFAAIGNHPQDLKYNGENSKLIIGKNTTIRENTSINTGTLGGGMVTTIGENCLIMSNCHIGHDSTIGNNCILATGTGLAGHVEIGESTVVGGMSGIQQFVKIGNNVMIGGMTAIREDIIPFGQVFGNPAILKGINLIGLKRLNFPKEEIQAIRKTFKELFNNDQKPFSERIEFVSKEYLNSESVQRIITFLSNDRSRPLCKSKILDEV